jgi:N-acetylglutamate synthase-like GNAT family acetyltransferase
MSTAQQAVEISTDAARLDRDWIFETLRATYWAGSLTREQLDRSIANSLAFGVYDGGRQIAFARVVSDRATFAWLADVIVDESQRGRGIGVKLVETIIAHPELQDLRRWMLATRDAHGLYEKFGFRPLPEPERFMEIRVADAGRGR